MKCHSPGFGVRHRSYVVSAQVAQDAARHWLARGESTVSTAADQIDPQQVKEQAHAATQMPGEQMRPRSQTR